MNKKLYRSRENKIIAGVIGGFAEYFDIDPTLLRIIWVLLTFLGMGVLLIVYIVAIFVMPLRPLAPEGNKQP